MADESKQALPGSHNPGWAQGMTLREWYAGLAMQGELAADPESSLYLVLLSDDEMKKHARGWVRAANALLAALKES